MQICVQIVTFHQLFAPVRHLERLVNQQRLAACADKLATKLDQRVLGEIQVIKIYVQTLPTAAEMFLGVLQQEGCFSTSPAAFDADQTVSPIDFIHKQSAHGEFHVLYQILVCLIKGV